ncbi:MAG: saccharopine dehydrogenase NADP-binding domain-containing protein, partial [Rubrivivax sp.]
MARHDLSTPNPIRPPMRLTLLGAGHIGRTIARWLAASGDYQVTVVDRDAEALAELAARPLPMEGGPAGPLADGRAALPLATRVVDTEDVDTVAALLAGQDAVVNALPYHLATRAATAAGAA